MIIGYQNLEFIASLKGSPINLVSESKQLQNKDEGDEEEGAPDDEVNKIKSNFWNHIAIVYDSSQTKKILFYLNCTLVASSETTLANDLFREQQIQIGNYKLNAELTEFRFWGSSLSLSEIKEQYRMPLEIVYEKKKEIKVKFKALNKTNNTTTALGLPKPGGVVKKIEIVFLFFLVTSTRI